MRQSRAGTWFYVLLLGSRGGAAAGRAAEIAGLIHRRLEVSVAITEGDAPLANRHAAIGFTVDAAVNGDELVGRTFDLNQAIDQDLATAVHRNEIGGAIAFSGHDNHPAGLQRDVRNQRISDHDGGDPGGQLDEPCLIDIHRDRVGGGLGEGGCRQQQHRSRERRQWEA
jgi:hypothetical protein